MDITFYKGVLMGIMIALPSGAVSFIIIRRMYLFGMKSGMYSVIGALLTDVFYAVIVGFGLKSIERFLVGVSGYAEIAAGIILCVSAYKALHDEPIDLSTAGESNHPIKDISTIAVLNLLNPALVLSFAAMFLLFGMGPYISHPKFIFSFIIGILAGSFGIWYVFGRIIIRMRAHNRPDVVSKISKVTGCVLGVLGIILILLAIVHIVFPK